MAKRTKKQAKSRLLKVEALEQRQLLAGGFTSAQGQEFSDIVHPNGNVYDQVLLKSSSINITNDPGQITRVSFLDQQGDIVQVEFGGSGTLSISLDASTFKSGVAPTNYNQSGISYVQGLASITISGSDATTNLNVFTVGSATAVNQSLFDSTHTGGNNVADIQRVTIVANPANPNGSTFGSIFAGNVNFTGSTGPVGITAANVQVQGVVNVGDINATGSAIPTLVFGTASQFGSVNITGGDLLSPNGAPINNNGSYLYTINLTAGTLSNGATDAAENTYSQLSFTGQNPVTATTKVFTLSTSVDSIVGTSGNDAINGQLGGAGGSTLTALDTIDGAGGNDTLSINDVAGNSGLPGGLTIKNVETINLASAGIAKIDTSASGITGVTALNVLSSTGADVITAGAGQAVTVFDSAGLVTLTGGTTQNVTTVGGVALSGATGAITVSDSNQGTQASTVTGGTSVSYTTSTSNVSSPAAALAGGAITIGSGTPSVTGAPSGAITLSDTLTGSNGANTSGGNIIVTGGTTDSVTITSSQPVNASAASVVAPAAANTAANYTLTIPSVTVYGSSATTSVSVSGELATVAALMATGAKTANGTASTESAVIKFVNLTAGQDLTIAGQTYVAGPNGATAAQVAAAFANVSSGLAYMGTSYTTGAVTGGDTVTFTATATGNATDLVVSSTNMGAVAATYPMITQGSAVTNAAVAATAGKAGITPSLITITDLNGGASTATISSVTLNNFAAGANISSGALASLSLTGTGGAVAITNTAAKTLDLTVNGVVKDAAGANVTPSVTNGTYSTVNVHTTGADSSVDIVAAAATTLNVDGTKKLTATGSSLGVLTTVNVSGSASLALPNAALAALTTINASGTTGTLTAYVDAGATTVTGGSGNDSITINGTVPTKAIDGGAGTDTLTVDAAAYASSTKVTGFETLAVTKLANGTFDATGFTTINVPAATLAGATTFSNVGAGTALNIAGAPGQTITYSLKDGSGSTDSATVSVNGANTLVITGVGGGVETVNLTNTGANSTVTLTSAATTLNATGSKNLTLVATNANNPSLVTIDASGNSGVVSYTTTGVLAQTVKGGSGADVLQTFSGASTTADTLNGGAGNDTLLGNAGLTTLTGGAGSDLFVIRSAPANVNTYNTTDASSSDSIQLLDFGTETFARDKVVLGSGTAVFQDYANTVVTNAGDVSMNAYIGWFQFNGDTYIVEARNHTARTTFTNGVDVVVKISGLVDLSTALMSTAGAVAGISAGGEPVILVH